MSRTSEPGLFLPADISGVIDVACFFTIGGSVGGYA